MAGAITVAAQGEQRRFSYSNIDRDNSSWGIRCFNRDRSVRVVNYIEEFWGETGDANADPAYDYVRARLIEEFWGETGDANADPAYDYVRARLHGRTAPTRIAKPIPAVRLITGIGKFLIKAGFSLGHSIRTVPSGSIYINTGHLGLAIPQLLTWLWP